MIDRLIISAALSITGYNGLYPDPPPPLTLKQKAKEKSIIAVCHRKPKSQAAKDFCERWEKHA